MPFDIIKYEIVFESDSRPRLPDGIAKTNYFERARIDLFEKHIFSAKQTKTFKESM